ncbi:MAG: HNH endonuclease [Betaproteobacteria bacterium]|nr:HNH endonuclease [Betaproteobacteria bacterium]
MLKHLLAVFLILFLAPDAGAAQKRSAKAKAEFRKLHPCPATGKTKGKCPGYQIDHIIPLCSGGADHSGNMQWLGTKAHKAKTKKDRQECRDEKKHMKTDRARSRAAGVFAPLLPA